MIVPTIAVLAAFLASGAQAPALTRQDRQDAIYEIRGTPDALKAFHEQVGKAWTGGTVVDADTSDGSVSYWAYSDRTAAEARALMMPAIMNGLQLTPEAYSEAASFPAERSKLDHIASKCGAKIDPFFIAPNKSVEITVPDGADAKLSECLSNGVRLEAQLLITTPLQGQEKR